MRDGKKAVMLASRACELSGWKDSFSLEALAAAHAECGNFAEAIKWEERALSLLDASEADLKLPRVRLKYYQKQQPYRDK